MQIDFTIVDTNKTDNQTNLKKSRQVYMLDELGALVVCQALYDANKDVDKLSS